jgi:nitroreductase
MNVTDALFARYSCRSFKSDPVDRDTLTVILKAATRAPSGGNSQPWEVFVAGGDVLERIKQGFLRNVQNGLQPGLDIPGQNDWPAVHRTRMKELLADMAVTSGDAVKQIGELAGNFFNASVVIYLCIDKNLTALSFFSLGMLAQSIMLEALDHGLSTIPAGCFVQYPEVLHKELGIPNVLSVVTGIAIGYEDSLHPINTFRSNRRTIEEVVTFKGFE